MLEWREDDYHGECIKLVTLMPIFICTNDANHTIDDDTNSTIDNDNEPKRTNAKQYRLKFELYSV
jgi:hypothetical protein